MPLLHITTNQPIDPQTRSERIRQASSLVAEMLGKPERYVMVNLTENADMSFGGSSESLAYLELKSIGLPAARTSDFSKTLCGFIQETFGIAPERIYIEFSDAERHLWGWNSTTF
ncbi:MAG: phenylpyruvate tautomerase MIF-related protein [Candidatus Thiodiazotropha sp.]|jgi:phenylpyruvate tautomerase